MSRNLSQWGRLLRDVLRRQRIRILAYHNIAVSPEDPFCVSPQAFVDQMQLVAKSRLPVISLAQAVENLSRSTDIHPALVITFDDAYADLLHYAIPTLLQHHFPATIFAVTDRAGQISDWGESSPSYPTLGWPELAHLSSLGFTIGSHTQTHSHLPTLDYPTLQRELAASKEIIHLCTGQRFIPLAYPYGEFGDRERSVAQMVGYPSAVAVGGLWGNGKESDIFALRRELMVNNSDLNTLKRTILGQNDFVLVFRDPYILTLKIKALVHFGASLRVLFRRVLSLN